MCVRQVEREQCSAAQCSAGAGAVAGADARWTSVGAGTRVQDTPGSRTKVSSASWTCNGRATMLQCCNAECCTYVCVSVVRMCVCVYAGGMLCYVLVCSALVYYNAKREAT